MSLATPIAPREHVADATLLPLAFTGWGAALPACRLTNDDLARVLDTSDEWIATRTGIRSRHVHGPGETTAASTVKSSSTTTVVFGPIRKTGSSEAGSSPF